MDTRTCPEDGQNNALGFSEKSIRRGFIKKVYGILTIQLILTFAIVALFVLVDPVKVFARDNSWLFWIAIGVMLVSMIVLVCCSSVRRKTPQNYIFLFIFTFAEGYLLGCISARYDAWEVLAAVAATALVTVSLTIFAFQTKIDFTMLNGILFVCTIILLIFGIFAAIFRSHILSMVYAGIGALIFSVYIVVDTQMMMGGNHKYSLSPEEYVFAALNLYIDIIQLFIYLLALIGGASGD